jgi:hypothetical protein
MMVDGVRTNAGGRVLVGVCSAASNVANCAVVAASGKTQLRPQSFAVVRNRQ